MTEHQLIDRRYDCGTVTKARPTATAQLSSNRRIAAALAELFGTPVSGGTVATASRCAAGDPVGFLELVRGEIADAEVADFDETGLRVEGQRRWVHSASTGRYSLTFCHDK